MIVIKKCTTDKEIKAFVKFPFLLYKNSPYWVPPIINDEVASFNPLKNPVFEHAEATFYMAYRNERPVGRICVIINWQEVREQNIKKVRFGWMDMVDDIEVTKALLSKVSEHGKANGLEYMEGPIGFSNMDKVGVQTEGFDQLGTMITWYNHSYYKNHFIQLGFEKEKGYIESYFSFHNVKPDFFIKASAMISKRYELRALNFKTTKEVLPYVDRMFDLFNDSYSKLSSFVAISEKQKAYFKEKYINFINPEYIKFIVDKDDQLVSFSIVMPSFSQALQKAKGKLFPFGIFHLLHARKHSKEVVFYLIGIRPEYQNKGVTAMIFNEYYPVFKAKGIERCIRTPELEENQAIHQLWKHFDPTIHVKRVTFKKEI